MKLASVSPLIRLPLLATAALAVVGVSGCSSSSTSSSDTMARVEPAAIDTDLEARYVIGPAAARKIGYRTEWQHPAPSAQKVTKLHIAGDSVFALDEMNLLTRLDRQTGRTVWQIPVADSFTEVLGLNYVPQMARVIVITSGDMFVHDAATGEMTHRDDLTRFAASSAVAHGQYLLYSARDGNLAWWNFGLGADWKAYRVSEAMTVPPVYSDGYVVAVGSGGRIVALDAGSATQMWNRRALDEIIAAPAIGDGVVFVPSLDQHLRAYELGTNRTPIWDYLTESPLMTSPTLIGDRIYQQVAAEGLVCLEAQPLDSPGGVVIWTAEGVTGDVLTSRQSDLLAWDDTSSELAIIDRRIGSLVETWSLPGVSMLETDDVDRGALYAVGTDGRIQKLRPRN